MAILPGCGLPSKRIYSPQGNWVAIVCLEPRTGVYSLEDHTKSYLLDYREILGTGNEGAFGSLKIVYWSLDERYLYLTPYPCCMDGPCVDYEDGLELIRCSTS